MKIHQLAEITGLAAPTIRFYEREGLLDGRHVHRQDNNYRDYSEEAVTRITWIKKLQGVGFSLAELKDVFLEHDASSLTISHVVQLLANKIAEIERKQDEFAEVLGTLHTMLEGKIKLMNGAQGKNALYKLD